MDSSAADEVKSIIATGTGSAIKAGLASLGPPGAIAVQALNDAEFRSVSRRVKTIEYALTQLSMTVDDLAQELANNDELNDFWERVLSETEKTRNDRKLRSFADILKAATIGERPLIETNLYLLTLSKIDDDHIKVLVLIKEIGYERPKPNTGIVGDYNGAEIQELTDRLGVEQELAQILVNDLQAAQLIHSVSANMSYGGGIQPVSNYLLTGFGERIWGFFAADSDD